MIISYATEHKWVEPILDDPMDGLGKNNRARLRSTLKNIYESGVTHSIELLTPEILAWFVPLYQAQISEKNNPKIHDIASNTIDKKTTYQYFALILKENGEPIGATIFSERKKILSIAYRIYSSNWKYHSFQASPSLYTEYLINRYAYRRGYRQLSHGKDRNPYGQNASIGLALFKLSVGCSVFLPSADYETKTIDLDSVTEDLLIFEHPQDTEKRITKGYLCVSNESLARYENVTKYPAQIKIEVIIRD